MLNIQEKYGEKIGEELFYLRTDGEKIWLETTPKVSGLPDISSKLQNYRDMYLGFGPGNGSHTLGEDVNLNQYGQLFIDGEEMAPINNSHPRKVFDLGDGRIIKTHSNSVHVWCEELTYRDVPDESLTKPLEVGCFTDSETGYLHFYQTQEKLDCDGTKPSEEDLSRILQKDITEDSRTSDQWGENFQGNLVCHDYTDYATYILKRIVRESVSGVEINQLEFVKPSQHLDKDDPKYFTQNLIEKIQAFDQMLENT